MKGVEHMQKLLTIAIPTYNRENELSRQIEFIMKEVKDYIDQVEVIISDNSSTDSTQALLKKYREKHSELKININEINLGLVGNLYKLIDLTESKYIWFVGDDDEIYEGAIGIVIEILKNNPDLNMVFINHMALRHNTNEIIFEKAYSGFCGLRKDGIDAFTDIFLETNTSLMFITACVYKTQNISQYRKEYDKDRLEAPLYFSMKSFVSENIYITEEVLISNYWGENSWSDKSYDILFNGVFDILLNLREHGFCNKQKKKMIKSYLLNKQYYHMLSLYKNPLMFFKLIIYYDFNHLKRLASRMKNLLRNL